MIFITPACLAWYRQHDDSICAKSHSHEVKARIEFLDWMKAYLVQNDVDIEILNLVRREACKVKHPVLQRYRDNLKLSFNKVRTIPKLLVGRK